MPIEGCDYFVRVMKFPEPVPAFVRLNSDGTYSLYLNADYDLIHWIDDYEHELWHIIHDDLYGEKNITEIERSM